MDVTIKTISHETQRYPTPSDWTWDGDSLTILVSDMGDWKKEMCVAYHELFEALACRADGVAQKQVDDFDMEFEKNRAPGDLDSEPGNQPTAPYFKQHQAAMNPELWLAFHLGLDWNEYDDTIKNL